MIGLEIFRAHFARNINQYVLIGGAACTLLMEDVGLKFRGTKDLDIVLYIEASNDEFFATFREFIKRGSYQNRQRSSGKEVFYRFDSPSDTQFPTMLELFSRNRNADKINMDGQIQRIKMNEATTSLSAILLNDDYYQFIHVGRIEIKGLSVVSASYLIPLKARAWMDLTDKQKQGVSLDSRDINKHKNDVMRLYKILSPEDRILLPNSIRRDMQLFVDRLKNDVSLNIKQLGLKDANLEEILGNFKMIYDLT